tara:strand:+ start:1564 stop:1746 length:183 start_codon:yes stop_codon:yes gene_type:complete
MENMNITSAQYVSSEEESNSFIECMIEGKRYVVPCVAGNRHYDEIVSQVEAGTLTIADAD